MRAISRAAAERRARPPVRDQLVRRHRAWIRLNAAVREGTFCNALGQDSPRVGVHASSEPSPFPSRRRAPSRSAFLPAKFSFPVLDSSTHTDAPCEPSSRTRWRMERGSEFTRSFIVPALRCSATFRAIANKMSPLPVRFFTGCRAPERRFCWTGFDSSTSDVSPLRCQACVPKRGFVADAFSCAERFDIHLDA